MDLLTDTSDQLTHNQRCTSIVDWMTLLRGLVMLICSLRPTTRFGSGSLPSRTRFCHAAETILQNLLSCFQMCAFNLLEHVSTPATNCAFGTSYSHSMRSKYKSENSDMEASKSVRCSRSGEVSRASPFSIIQSLNAFMV